MLAAVHTLGSSCVEGARQRDCSPSTPHDSKVHAVHSDHGVQMHDSIEGVHPVHSVNRTV